METPASLAAQLENLERELHDPNIRRSPRVEELLAEDFVEFGRSGRIYNKAQILQALSSESAEHITSAEYKVNSLAPGVALVTYKSHRPAREEVYTLRSSIWRRHGSTWKMIFHQGTPTTVAT
jgi:hypothetical protein